MSVALKGAGSLGWSPTALGSALHLWLPRGASNVDPGATFTWYDRSGNGRNASRATNKPQYAALGGVDCVRDQGGVWQLDFTRFALVAPITLYARVYCTDTGATNAVLNRDTTSGGQPVGGYYAPACYAAPTGPYSYTNNSYPGAPPALTANTWTTLRWRLTTTEIASRVNAGAEVSTAGANLPVLSSWTALSDVPNSQYIRGASARSYSSRAGR